MAEDVDKQDKTEDATPRRREEARERGQVALSSEVLSAGSLVAGLGALLLAGGLIAASTASAVVDAAHGLGVGPLEDLEVRGATALLQAYARPAGLALAAFVVPMALIVVLSGYAQVGLRITPKAMEWKLERLDPSKNVGKVFSKRGVVRTSSALLKIVLIGVTMGVTAWTQLPRVAGLEGSELGPVLAGMGQIALRATIAAIVAIVVVAICDFAWQRWQHEQELRMSRKELRDEHKNTDGDPQVKSRIRQLQREMARSRMMAEVPKATVVITNPTHYAVALRYDREQGSAAGRAPRVVAKGVERVAQRIKQVAAEAGVPCYEDVPLARALHAQVEIGDEIPERCYQAVAAALAYVFRVRDGARRRAAGVGT
jgi:flagellar biosynthetic protein FlhB